MRNRYNDKELADQLQLDLAEGESWHVDFKEYDHRRLDEKIADSWKLMCNDSISGCTDSPGASFSAFSVLLSILNKGCWLT